MEVIDITKLRRVNNLASTLNKHGLAVNKLEAVELARNLQGGNEDMDYLGSLKVNDRQGLEVVDTSNGQQMYIEKYTSSKDHNFITKEQVESILQKFCDLFGEELNKINAQINGLDIKFNYLQEQLAEASKASSVVQTSPSLGQPQPAFVQPQPVQQMQQSIRTEPENNVQVSNVQPQVQQQPQQPAGGNKDGNHKTGNFSSSDVDIEKFFYFGNKK